jgi:type I restriction enzyme M protein
MDWVVPAYYDARYIHRFREAMTSKAFAGFEYMTIRALLDKGLLHIRGGHGSPPHDQRIGQVPYIKVSDLRAGAVNINPTNRVPRAVAERFWGGSNSGLKAYDLLSPERASKNIGDFCVLMPGQEPVVLTKEIIVFRPGPSANFDAFYLLWAMTLKIVRDQWKRIIFMQTNREDVGTRYYEIEIPLAVDPDRAERVSKSFREYYLSVSVARERLMAYLHAPAGHDHHFYVSGIEPPAFDEKEFEEEVSTESEGNAEE